MFVMGLVDERIIITICASYSDISSFTFPGVFFDNRVEHVKFVDFCGKYRLPLLQYLCSSKCIGSREGEEEVVSGAMIRKVLLG